jgi:putative hydrolase of the HAD superfamily
MHLKVLLLDMYGVIIKESKGNFKPYVYARFPETDYGFFRDLYENASLGKTGSDFFFAKLGFENPKEAMRDYIENYLTPDGGFIPFAERFSGKCTFALLSNDILSWSEHIREHYGIEKYFRHAVISANTGFRKPDKAIFAAALEQIGADASDCVFVDNSTANLRAASEFGINTVLFNRDNEQYDGHTVNSFEELAALLENYYPPENTKKHNDMENTQKRNAPDDTKKPDAPEKFALSGFSALINRIDELLAQNIRVTCAIEGGCASGKSTLAAALNSHYGCNVFKMDDFFLRPFQRTPERLAETGGNIDYERFKTEVLLPLQSGEPFAYRPYDCSVCDLSRKIAIYPKKVNIIEGVYSMHPYFEDCCNIKVFLQIGHDEQKKRLIKRNKDLYERFEREWIPMENAYFREFKIREKCDLVFDGVGV